MGAVVRRVRHRINSAWVQGMTAQNPARGQQTAAPGAKALDSFQSIMRTTGLEAAAWRQQGADQSLIETDQRDDHCLDEASRARHSCSRSATISLSGLRPAPGRAITTYQPGRGAQRRKLARVRRLIRLRRTALGEALRLIARPSRAGDCGCGNATTVQIRPRCRRPRFITCANSLGNRRRCERGGFVN